MRVIDNVTLVAYRYDDPDVWISQDDFSTGPGRWYELRMRCNYTRHVERFSILYTGPAGETRVRQGGRKIPGPHGSLIPQPTVIAAAPVAKASYIDVEEGDVIVLNGQRMVIADDQPTDYPHLVTEAEWGLIVARRVVKDEINAIQASTTSDDTQAVATVITLYKLSTTLTETMESLRNRSRAETRRSA